MLKIKEITIHILLNFYFLTKLNFLLNIISFFAGPLFVKIFQAFNYFQNLQNLDTMNGTIGIIEKEDKIIKKILKENIKDKMKDSFDFLNSYINFININLPFEFDSYFNINMEQFDMNKERDYSLRLTEIFKNIKDVKIINIFESTETYHLSEFIEGFRIDYFLSFEENKKYEKEIFSLLNLSYCLMLSNNLFHCDWHFGNFIVDIKNDKVKLFIIDTGLMGKLDNNSHLLKLKILLKTNFLKPEPINILKFLCSVNINKNSNINSFIYESKENIKKMSKQKTVKEYQNILVNFIKLSSKYKLKFPIVIMYMFQSILFLNNTKEDVYKNLISYSKQNGFFKEIINNLNV